LKKLYTGIVVLFLRSMISKRLWNIWKMADKCTRINRKR